MEEVRYTPCSGTMSESELVNWRANTSMLVSGMPVSGMIDVTPQEPVDEQLVWSSWVSGPANWPLIETIGSTARNYGLEFIMDSMKTTGFFFKRTIYSFTVRGKSRNFARFVEWYNRFADMNS